MTMRSASTIEKTICSLSDNYVDYHKQFLHMHTEYKFMCDGHIIQVNIAKHFTELATKKTQPIFSSLYRAAPRSWKLEKAEIDKMLSWKVSELAQME